MVKIEESKWRKSFVLDINEKIRFSEKEYELYKKTGYVIYLQQSCNKLFSAMENYLMLKYEKRVRSYHELVKLVSNNSDDSYILSQTVQLHYFFYNGELQMSKNEATLLYINIKRKLKERMKKQKW